MTVAASPRFRPGAEVFRVEIAYSDNGCWRLQVIRVLVERYLGFRSVWIREPVHLSWRNSAPPVYRNRTVYEDNLFETREEAEREAAMLSLMQG